MLKKNSQFSQRIRGFKEQILKWVTELCKEESRRDFDNMAKLISDYEKLEHEGVIGWALGRIHAYFPTIDQAEKKLNGVIEAVQYKNKRFQQIILEKNKIERHDLSQVGDDVIFDSLNDSDYDDQDAAAIHAASNINYVHQKLQDVKEIIIDKMHESIQKMFETFVREFTHDQHPLFNNKLIFYCLLKTEGDIMIELDDYDKAIKAYKALRNYCRVWGLLEQEMWMAEQIGVSYRELRYHELAVDYFKCQLSLAWELNDLKAEMRSYENLSMEYYYIGNIDKAKLYHNRVFRGYLEHPDSTAKHASALLNNYNRNFKEVKYKFDQIGLKGVDAEDKGKRANFGEYNYAFKYIPKEESA